MNKTSLVKEIFQEIGHLLPKHQVNEIVDNVFSKIRNSLKNNQEVRIKDFGTLKVITRMERIGRNPKTGEKITIPERKVVKFVPSKELKNL